MRNQSNSRPSVVENYKPGVALVNYDIVEMPAQPQEDGESRTEYHYTSVEVSMPIEYGPLVSAMIRERYSSDDEHSIVRKMMAIDACDNRENILQAFEEYNIYAEECKTKAKSIISQI